MTTLRRILASAFIAIAAAAPAATAQGRPVASSWMAGAGTARLSDAYLAPFATSGWGAAVIYERAQALRSRPEQWSSLLSLDLGLTRTHTAATRANGTMWGATLTVEGAALRRFAPLPFGLRLAAGPSVELLAGAHYRPSNGNNPVAAQAALTAGITARAGYPLRIGRLPVEMSFRPSLQLTGVFFAPAYGELYYEIYEGDRRNLARFAWPGNRLSYSHLLAADLRLGSTSLRLGYSLRLSTREASGLATNAARHLVVVGITSDFLSLSRRSTNTLPDEVVYPF